MTEHKYALNEGATQYLREPWRTTRLPVWGKDGGGWHEFIPAKVTYAGVDGYYRGEAKEQ